MTAVACPACGHIDNPEAATWRINLDAVLDAKGRMPLSLNDRGNHWAVKATKIARVKTITRNAILAADVPPMPRVHVETHYRPATNRFRDIDNTVATLKPVIDALHQPDTAPNAPVPYHPIVPGDDPRYLTWARPQLHPWVKGQPASLWIVLTALEASDEH
jgi:hypothetical protein